MPHGESAQGKDGPAIEVVLGVAARMPLVVQEPVPGQLSTSRIVNSELPHRRRRGGKIQQNNTALRVGKGHGERVSPQSALTTTEGSYTSAGIKLIATQHDGRHPFFGRHFGIGPQASGMTDVTHGDQPNPVFPGQPDSRVGGESSPHLPEDSVSIDPGQGLVLEGHNRTGPRVQPAFLDDPDVVWDS